MMLLATLSLAAAASAADRPSDNAAALARALIPPTPVAKRDAEFEEAEFYQRHGELLRAAWRDYGLADESLADFRSAAVIAPSLADAVDALRERPSPEREAAVLALFNETAPGVFCGQLLRADAIAGLRAELARVAASDIPTRRPNGMNRYGVILDEEVDGAVSHGLAAFVRALVAAFVRPLGRMLFAELVGAGDDAEQFAFTVRYRPEGDADLAEHRDASVFTLNLNLNSPGEGYGGSALSFQDAQEPSMRHTVEFTPGMALIHQGALRHAALPIEHGARENLIVWLFGDDGYVRAAPRPEAERLSLEERWGLVRAQRRHGSFLQQQPEL